MMCVYAQYGIPRQSRTRAQETAPSLRAAKKPQSRRRQCLKCREAANEDAQLPAKSDTRCPCTPAPEPDARSGGLAFPYAPRRSRGSRRQRLKRREAANKGAQLPAKPDTRRPRARAKRALKRPCLSLCAAKKPRFAPAAPEMPRSRKHRRAVACEIGCAPPARQSRTHSQETLPFLMRREEAAVRTGSA